MKILDRYIATQLNGMILLVALALLGIDIFFYLITELRFVGKGNYNFFAAICFVVLTIPRKIYIMFPWSALLGSLLALGNLARSNELIAMRAAAVSIHRIGLAALKGAVVLVVAMILLGEIVAPATEQLAQQKKTAALSKGQTIETDKGIWIRNEHEFIYVGNIVDKKLVQIEKYNFDENLTLQEVITAEQATAADMQDLSSDATKHSVQMSNELEQPHKNSKNKEYSKWKLQNIHGTRFIPSLGKTQGFTMQELLVPKLVDLTILEAAQVKHLERLSIKHLLKIIKDRSAHELNTQNYQVAVWTKIFQPLVILVMVYLAIPFVFCPLRQASMGLKLLTGVLVGFGFHTVHSVFTQLPTVFNLNPVFAMALPPIIFFAIGYTMLSRVR